MFVHFFIVFFVFPELKGRTAAEVDEMFEARLPARKFKGEAKPSSRRCAVVDIAKSD